MAYASQAGRARTNARNPRAHAICDRCGFRYNMQNLRWQYDWRGAALANIRVLVCGECLDTPQEQLRSITIPSDPDPVPNARPENFVAASTDFMATVGGSPMTTISGVNMTTDPIGEPNGLEPGGIMPLNQSVTYGASIAVLSMTSSGSNIVYVTCSAPHGLSTGSQISVEGLSSSNACGFYSVTVISAMVFEYSTYSRVPKGSLLTPKTQILTCLVGLPYNYSQIPLTPAPGSQSFNQPSSSAPSLNFSKSTNSMYGGLINF